MACVTDLGRDSTRAWTPVHVNERIDHRTQLRVRRFVGRDRRAIERRIAALDREWDIDRVVVTLYALGNGIARERALAGRFGWKTLSRLQNLVLLGYLAIGWAPPITLLRSLGFRTKSEIEVEKRALERILEGRHGALESKRSYETQH